MDEERRAYNTGGIIGWVIVFELCHAVFLKDDSRLYEHIGGSGNVKRICVWKLQMLSLGLLTIVLL